MTGRVLLPGGVTPSHYMLELSPNLESFEFVGNEEITIQVDKPVDEITLHQNEIFVVSALYKNSTTGVCIAVNETNYNNKLNILKFVFESQLPVGSGCLIIKFKGVLNNDMAGFYRSSYTDSDGKKKFMASTQFESLDARRAFPCWDEPAVKATFAVTLIIPSNLTALSNMPELSTTHLSNNKKKVVFDTTPKMSTYLVAFAVGEFDFVQGITKNGVNLRVFSPPGRAEQGKFALDVGIRSLDFFDGFFQVPYPLPKLDMICITEFACGAMENWGLVTYRETALMIDQEKASSAAKQRVAIVIAHELAHQWFGNLVTMSWWDGLWLNEGFAAFMEHFAVDALFPDYKIWEQYTTDAFGSAQRLDALRSSHPIIVPIAHAEEVEQVFDAISYCKGSTVVNMVAAIVGKENFQTGLQLYMKRHAYGNTETIDLWNAWSEVSGKDIAGLMKTWTTVTGYPYLKVVSEEWSDKEVVIALEQARFLSDGSADEGTDLWSIPLLFASADSTSTEAVIMDQKVQTFAIPLAASTRSDKPWIKINAGQKALVRVAHTSEMISRLRPAIAQNLLSPVDRAALLLDGYALAKAGLAPLETVVEILRAYENETSSIVWDAMAGVLNGFYILLQQLDNKVFFEKFVAFGKSLVVKVFASVGWDSRDTDSHTDKLLRSTVFGLLDTFAWQDEVVAAEAKRRFDAHWTDATVLPSDYRTTVYNIVLMNGGLKEYEAILASYRATEDSQEQKYALNSLGGTRDVALKRRTLDWAMKSGEVRLQDLYSPIGAVADSVVGSEMAWKYFQEHFPLIKEKLSKASPALMSAVIVNCISRFVTAERADEIEAFFKANPLPNSAQRISQSLENMRTLDKMLVGISKSKLAEDSFW